MYVCVHMPMSVPRKTKCIFFPDGLHLTVRYLTEPETHQLARLWLASERLEPPALPLRAGNAGMYCHAQLFTWLPETQSLGL